MLPFTADPRDGIPAGASCNTCCCAPISLMPGETNQVMINYAPWSVPLSPPGIVPSFDYAIERNISACPTGSIAGFIPPNNDYYVQAAPSNVTTTLDVSSNVTPSGNTFTYSIVPLTGPYNGSATIDPITGIISYTPMSGFTGWDLVWYETLDAQGRSVIRSASFQVNGTTLARPMLATLEDPFIDRSKIETNQSIQIVKFPIYMPISVRDCDQFKLTIKQPARDCAGTVFNHFMCFDIVSRNC